MPDLGLCGPSYTSQSVNADCQSTVNWYPEILAAESQNAKSKVVLYPCPGLRVFATLPEGPVRAEIYFNGRFFAVGGTKFCEVFADGTVTPRGDVSTDGLTAYIASGATMLSIASGGHLYAFTLATNAFLEIDTTSGAALQGPVSIVKYSDGYYIALLANSDKFQLSALLDATSWDPLDIGQVSVFPDNVITMEVDHRQVWAIGAKASQPYDNTGNALFPFDVTPGAYIEQGAIARDSVAKLDNTIFLLGGDERGAGIAWRFQGYTPLRISNHAVENAWQGYSTITDAVGYAYQDQGHSFYVLYFPSANKTWVYDVESKWWHERSSMVNGVDAAHLSRCHAFGFQKHLVGDRNSGNIYEMSISLYDDAGTPIHRVRRAPHISDEERRIFYSFLQIVLEGGLGPTPPLTDGDGNFRAPQIMLRWSDDYGHTWSNSYLLDCGKAGEFRKRVFRNRMGQARDRVFEISTSDAIPWRIISSVLKAG
jgi:hypothetical protein